jgi:hypothetical protein
MTDMKDLTDRRQSNRPVSEERRSGERRTRNQQVLRERRLERRAIDLMLQDTTQPVRLSEIARWSGFSEAFVREDARSGVIQAIKIERRGRYIYVVPVPEAIRYLRTLGVAI